MKYVLPRQYKDLKPAQQALRQTQAPHHAGLFCFCTLIATCAAGVLALQYRCSLQKTIVGTLSGRYDGVIIQKKGSP